MKNTKELIVLGASAFQAYASSMKDGKIDAGDIVHLIPLIQHIGPALQDINLVPKEMLNISAAEMDELIMAVMEAAPDLKTKAEVLLRIRAVASLLVAAKDCYNAFTKPSAVPAPAFAANSFEGKVTEDGSMRAALRADAQGSKENAEAAAKKKEAIEVARVAKAAEPVAVPGIEAVEHAHGGAEKVADAEVAAAAVEPKAQA